MSPARLALLLLLVACRPAPERAGAGPVRLVLAYQPLGDDPRPLRALLDAFQAAHPGVEVALESLPSASDAAHQFFLTALEGRSTHFDLLIADVIWVPEFARAGWVADLSEAFPPEALRRDFLPGPVEACVQGGRTFAVPWYADVGLLLYRTDLVPRAPRTYAELESFARAARAKDPGLQGYLWQGAQYEGLVCNAYEAIWGHGARGDDPLLLDAPQSAAALSYLRGLLASGLSPASVTSAHEEESRRVFQAGRAAMLRTWPYAYVEAQRPGSPIQGRVAVAALPTVSGEPGPGALGGWQLALNAHSPPEKRAAALALLAHLTSLEASRVLARDYGRNPARLGAYQDPEVKAGAPFVVELLPHLLRARPRPVTPYYNLLSDTLQSEFSAAVSGLRPPEVALSRAAAQAARLTREDR